MVPMRYSPFIYYIWLVVGFFTFTILALMFCFCPLLFFHLASCTLSVFSLYLCTLHSPPSASTLCCVAHSFPTLSLFSPASCKITTLPSLGLSVHAQESVYAPYSGACLCEWPCESAYFTNTTDSKKGNKSGRKPEEKSSGDRGTGCSHVEAGLA